MFRNLSKIFKENMENIKRQKEILYFHREFFEHIQIMRFYQLIYFNHQTCTINQQNIQRNHYREYFNNLYENILNRHYNKFNSYSSFSNYGNNNNNNNNNNNSNNNNSNNNNSNNNNSNNSNNDGNNNSKYDFFSFSQHNYNFNQSRYKFYSHHHRHFYGHYYRRFYQKNNHNCNNRQHRQYNNPWNERFGLSNGSKTNTNQNNSSGNNGVEFCMISAICNKVYDCLQNPMIMYYLISKRRASAGKCQNIRKTREYSKLPKKHSSYHLNKPYQSSGYVTLDTAGSVTPLSSNNRYTMSNYILSQKITLRNSHSDANRYFSSSTPQLFVLSKLTRVLVPIAMTGVRSSLSKYNLLKRLGLIILILASATGTYLVVNQDEVPITGRSRLVSYSKEEEHELGKMGYDELSKEYSPYFLPENNVAQNRVREIAKRIIEVTGRKDLDWECHVVNSETVNACVLPNGKIFVFSGLLEICENEDELASVLSHEIGHAVARHAAERLSINKFGYVFLTLTRGLIGETITGNLTTFISANLLNLRYSRIQEIEADLIGLEYMAKANYNPYAALSIQKKLQRYENFIREKTGEKDLDFLSTHPAPEERINKIENWLNQNAQNFNNNVLSPQKINIKTQNISNNNDNSNNVNLSSSTRLSYLSQK